MGSESMSPPMLERVSGVRRKVGFALAAVEKMLDDERQACVTAGSGSANGSPDYVVKVEHAMTVVVAIASTTEACENRYCG
jgi:hypothetical protein